MLVCVQDTALNHAEQLFAEGDTNGDGVLSCEEVITLMLRVGVPLCYIACAFPCANTCTSPNQN